MTRPDNAHVGQKFVLNIDYCGYKKGELLTLSGDDSTDNPYFSSIHGSTSSISFSYLSPATGLDAIEVGDVLVDGDGDGDKRMVLACLGRNYLMSECDEPNVAGGWYTQKEIKDNDWKLERQLPTTETIEIAGRRYSKDEVEKRLKDLEEVK